MHDQPSPDSPRVAPIRKPLKEQETPVTHSMTTAANSDSITEEKYRMRCLTWLIELKDGGK